MEKLKPYIPLILTITIWLISAFSIINFNQFAIAEIKKDVEKLQTNEITRTEWEDMKEDVTWIREKLFDVIEKK